MDQTLMYLENQHELIMRQNAATLEGLNATLDIQQLLMDNQNVLALISENQQYMLMINFLGIMLVAFTLIGLTCQLEKITKRYEEEDAVRDGAYSKAPDA